MLVAFLIMLREGIEAALIVGIVAGFLKQSGYSHMMPKVWIGVVAAALMSIAASAMDGESTSRNTSAMSA